MSRAPATLKTLESRVSTEAGEQDATQAELADEIARDAHAGQVDQAGDDYRSQLARLAERVDGDGTKAVAWLHEILEETPVTPEALGQVVLEQLDLVPDCKNRRLAARHPEGPVPAIRSTRHPAVFHNENAAKAGNNEGRVPQPRIQSYAKETPRRRLDPGRSTPTDHAEHMEVEGAQVEQRAQKEAKAPPTIRERHKHGSPGTTRRRKAGRGGWNGQPSGSTEVT